MYISYREKERYALFKSNFSRYMITFALVIFLSFSAVAVATSVIMINYARESKEVLTDKLSEMIFKDIREGLETYDNSFTAAIASFRSTYSYSDKFAELNDSLIFITDYKGVVLYTSGAFGDIRKPYSIPRSVIKDFTVNAGQIRYNNLGGLLPTQYFNSAYPIKNPDATDADDILGLLFISASSNGVDKTVNSMISIILLVLFWVFVAAFTALYFIGERLNKPILLLQEKLANFAKGDFSVRMPETGVEEIDRIGVSFNSMADSLEKIESSRRVFLTNISHDLRTPMTAIQGFVEAMLDGTVRPEKRDYYLSVISDEIKRLSRMVNELLDVSRIESGTLRLNQSVFDLCEMARLIVISLEERLSKKNIEFLLEADDYHSFVYADKDSIYQVLYNLIDNAVKFGNENGKIKLIVTKCVPTESDPVGKYRLSVYNTGSGISEEELPHVFDRFYKSDVSRGRDPHGAGLGLFIVKTVLDLHGESISVFSEEGTYCQFDFSLPSADNAGSIPNVAVQSTTDERKNS